MESMGLHKPHGREPQAEPSYLREQHSTKSQAAHGLKQVCEEAVIGSADLIPLLRSALCWPVSSVFSLICYFPLFSLRVSHLLLPQSVGFFHYLAAQGHPECSNLRPPVTLTE